MALHNKKIHTNHHYFHTEEEVNESLWIVLMATVRNINKMYGLCLRAVRQSPGLKLLQRRGFRISVSGGATLFHPFNHS